MHWFGGSIAEAVTLSKQKNVIFVVFVEGDNDLTAEMTAVLDDGDVLKRLSDESNFLAIKLQSGSINYTHFAKIYQFVPVPSLFFIGRNGTPLEVVCAGIQASNLATRIDRILDEHNKNKLVSMQPSTSGSNVIEQTTNLIQAEANTSAASVAPSTPVSPVTPSPIAPTSPATVAPVIVPPVNPTVTERTKSEPAPVSPAVPTSPVAPVTTATPATPTVPVTLTAPLTPTTSVTPAVPVAPLATIGSVNVAKHPAPQSEPETLGPAAKIPKLDGEFDVVCDGDVCVRRPRGDAGPSTPDAQGAKSDDATSALSTEEKMERAKELIEAKRREKAEKEKQLEKEKEKERRSVGQGVAELKRWQAEQEMKQIQEERKREKMENDLARQRILEQIALDRAERRARETRDAPAPPAAEVAPVTPGDGAARARIQFKLPDGAAHAAHFHAADTLGAVARYVADNLQLSTSQFSLWTTFPRRELTEHNETLRQLQLAPSAALVVLPRAAGAVARPGAVAGILAFLTQLFTSMILEPSQQLYNWIMGRISPPQNPPRNGSPPGTGTPRGAGTPRGTAGPAGSQPGPRRRGNVHRLTGDLPPDDDNNTWNGNSTQQM